MSLLFFLVTHRSHMTMNMRTVNEQTKATPKSNALHEHIHISKLSGITHGKPIKRRWNPAFFKFFFLFFI